MKKKLLATLIMSAFILTACADEEPSTENNIEETEEVVSDPEPEEDTAPEEEAEEEDPADEQEEVDEDPEPDGEEGETEAEETATALPEELQGLTVSDTRGDTTGNWRKVVTANNVNMPENALAYNQEYMEDDEVHHIISFATNTTTLINELSGTLMVDITEYVDGEEHSADTIGSGMLLKSYTVYIDSGEIIDLDEE